MISWIATLTQLLMQLPETDNELYEDYNFALSTEVVAWLQAKNEHQQRTASRSKCLVAQHELDEHELALV